MILVYKRQVSKNNCRNLVSLVLVLVIVQETKVNTNIISR